MQGLMSLLNAFSGAVFLIVGVTHLLPHVLEYQEDAYPSMKYPFGLVTICLGFLLILWIEEIIFDVKCGNHEEDLREPDPDNGVSKYTVLTNTISIGKKYQEPLITMAALNIHATLESIVLGLAVRPSSCCNVSSPSQYIVVIYIYIEVMIVNLYGAHEGRMRECDHSDSGVSKCTLLESIHCDDPKLAWCDDPKLAWRTDMNGRTW
jgi:hypothetical protein